MQSTGSAIQTLARHRVGANVLMVVFCLAGLWAILGIQTRFFPEFASNTASVSVNYDGVNVSEIQDSIVIPLENELRGVSDLESMYSYSRDGSGRIILEFPFTSDIKRAFEDIKTKVGRVNLPTGADKPRSSLSARDETILVMSVVTENRDELRAIARRVERDLRSKGIARMDIEGIADEEIQILIDQSKLVPLGLTLEEVGTALRAENQEITIGSLDGLGNKRLIRGGRENSEFHELYQIPIAVAQSGDPIYLRDISHIQNRPADDQVQITHNGKPAVRFKLINTGTGDIINSAERLYEWREQAQNQFPDSVDIIFHDEEWKAVQSRLDLLIFNGLSGLAIVLGVLFFFLSFPVAIWVAIGIPVAMLGTLFVFHLVDGSFNLISMFALIMAVGIIVDDAIVVGENAQYRLSRGDPPLRAVTSATRTMFIPVFASSFTTIASFLPLFLVGGTIGAIIFDIPLIIVCILIAALFECFCILPGHLYHSFVKRVTIKPNRFRIVIDAGFDKFREKYFRPMASFATRHALATCTACFMLLAVATGLMVNGIVPYRFFAGSEGDRLSATIIFHSGTERAVMEEFVNNSVALLPRAEKEASPDGKLVKHVTALYGQGGRNSNDGDEKAQIIVQLVESDMRSVTTSQFTNIWRRTIGALPPAIERLSLQSHRHGPPSEDIEIQLIGKNINDIKLASLQLQEFLADVPGTSSIGDDTAYGQDQYIFELTPLGRSLGLDIDSIARQLRFALDGFQVQAFQEGSDEIKLKVKYADLGTNALASTYILLPNREFTLLDNIVDWRIEQGFETILRQEGLGAITVSAALDEDSDLSPSLIISDLEKQALPELVRNHGISYSIEGSNSRHGDALEDMAYGLGLALVLIFVILTLVFRSWTLPLVVMITMPLGIIGTLLGHLVMGLTMSILSLFGMFTLMGIIVNNSIVLVRCFQGIAPNISDKESYEAAIVDAACLRLRAVLLTTLTTICGLLPLMFETSRQAQFLIPMAASIVFGLAFASLLILFFTPACIAIHGSCSRSLTKLKTILFGKSVLPPQTTPDNILHP